MVIGYRFCQGWKRLLPNIPFPIPLLCFLDQLNDLPGSEFSHIRQSIYRHEVGRMGGKEAGYRGRKLLVWKVKDVIKRGILGRG